MAERLRKDILAELSSTYDKANATVNMALETAMLQFKANNPRAAQEATKAAQAASVSMGIARTKLHELEDRPTTPEPSTDPRAAAAKLAQRLGIHVQSPTWPATYSGQPSPSPPSSRAPSPTRSLPSPPSQALLSPGITQSIDRAVEAAVNQHHDGHNWLTVPAHDSAEPND